MNILSPIKPKDYLEAIGPLFMVTIFIGLLYAISSGYKNVVILNQELLLWPLYQLIGFLVENSLNNFLLARKTGKEDDYLMSVAPMILLVGIMSFMNYSHWVLIVVAMQLLPLLAHRDEKWDQEKGCINALLKSFILIFVFILVILDVPEALGRSFDVSFLEGGFAYLPGMLIIGIVYYGLSAVMDVLMQPFLRGDYRLER